MRKREFAITIAWGLLASATAWASLTVPGSGSVHPVRQGQNAVWERESGIGRSAWTQAQPTPYGMRNAECGTRNGKYHGAPSGQMATCPERSGRHGGMGSEEGGELTAAGGKTGEKAQNALPASAKDAADRHLVASSAPKYNIWRSIGAIILILGGLLAVNSFLRKRQGFLPRTRENRSIRMLEKLAIDHRRSLVLLEADGRRILVGVGPERIETLADLGTVDGTRGTEDG